MTKPCVDITHYEMEKDERGKLKHVHSKYVHKKTGEIVKIQWRTGIGFVIEENKD